MLEAANRRFNPEREVERLLIVDPLDQQICVTVAETLMKHYPGYEWLIEADREKGFIDIRNLSLDGKLGCRIKMGGYASISELQHLAMQHGGEILERFHVIRGTIDHRQLEELPVDYAGRFMADK